ncbi:hypothetical protein VPHK469_0157 [Vibrio phage K469]
MQLNNVQLKFPSGKRVELTDHVKTRITEAVEGFKKRWKFTPSYLMFTYSPEGGSECWVVDTPKNIILRSYDSEYYARAHNVPVTLVDCSELEFPNGDEPLIIKLWVSHEKV